MASCASDVIGLTCNNITSAAAVAPGIMNATTDVTSTGGGGSEASPPSTAKLVHAWTYTLLYGYGLPALCIIGFCGNVLNFVVLPRKMKRNMTREGVSATIGLLALAIADLCFCVSAFPSMYLPQSNQYEARGFLLSYRCYSAAVINIFIMTSTWLTIVMATDRYKAICSPFKASRHTSYQQTMVGIALTFLLSAMFNMPVFWRYRVVETTLRDNVTLQYSLYQRNLINTTVDHIYRALWAILGNILPFVLLLTYHRKLATAIVRSTEFGSTTSHNERVNRRRQKDSNRITATLRAIVFMFLILVAPSEIAKVLVALFGGQDVLSNHIYLTIELVTNVTQTVNFSANFILYCIVNKSFRDTARELLFCKRRVTSRHAYSVAEHNDHTSSFRVANGNVNRYNTLRRVNSSSTPEKHNSAPGQRSARVQNTVLLGSCKRTLEQKPEEQQQPVHV